MDDVDAVQAQIARNMLDSGDWVTARLDGVPYLEKAPLIYWTIAICPTKFLACTIGSARIPMALSAIALCWADRGFRRLGVRQTRGISMPVYASPRALDLFLFTRILIPDVMLTCTIALAMWAFLRAIDPKRTAPRLWAFLWPPAWASACC